MFAPTKTYRRWHRKISKSQRRYATSSALAASAVPALVMARGHQIGEVNEIPCVVSGFEGVKKTKDAVAVLTALGAGDDLARCKPRTLRAGKGKRRNRRFVRRRGPLIVYDSNSGLVEAARNIPGVDLCQVTRLNLLQLAPGGHLGRFIVWTAEAFGRLDEVYGTRAAGSALKSGFSLPRSIMSTGNLARIINSDAVQSVLCAPKSGRTTHTRKRNPLTNLKEMQKLNPYATAARRAQLRAESAAKEARAAGAKKGRKARKGKGKAFYNNIVADDDEWNYGEEESDDDDDEEEEESDE